MSGPVLALGEVMLRFDPGEERIATARSFRVWEGGGEYNVAKALASCFGRPARVVTALVDDPLGQLVAREARAGGVDTSAVRWVPAYGPLGHARTGLNFVERGAGVRGALGVSDRSSSAASQLRPEDLDWDLLLTGASWLHTGGVFAALSDTTALVAEQALDAAARHGVRTSYDTNYRPSLWRHRGGREAALLLDERLASRADVVFGALGLDAEDHGELATVDELAEALARLGESRGHDQLLVSSWRRVPSAVANDFSGAAWSRATGAVTGPVLAGVPVLDRIGSGDAYAAGVLHRLLDAEDHRDPGADALREGLALGVAAGALTMSTPGDSLCASAAEVEALARGGTAHVRR
ncbi:2-dehydro-3-deoxygluconokinase [Motilibacter rhizosphaerae]|uniref:2-dehydro-3-deoxygluconokinase n=1 Tax=Motilibacter rhizosphaerae TaxID=598652 RepID=A0A4Q7NWQ4_9ACTN|nr:sugar kinase [Motilibacter rhizosphaerae]RZS91655.1 2-dehydro-3-deoxygluconokinase [Motilibacter rhizosphaerae]